MDAPMSSLFVSICNWAMAHGARRIDQLPGCWESDWTFDGVPAFVAINGSPTVRRDRAGHTIPPFTAYIEINGWPVAMVDPAHGTIMGGEPGIEDKLIAAFEAATVTDEPKA